MQVLPRFVPFILRGFGSYSVVYQKLGSLVWRGVHALRDVFGSCRLRDSKYWTSKWENDL